MNRLKRKLCDKRAELSKSATMHKSALAAEMYEAIVLEGSRLLLLYQLLLHWPDYCVCAIHKHSGARRENDQLFTRIIRNFADQR